VDFVSESAVADMGRTSADLPNVAKDLVLDVRGSLARAMERKPYAVDDTGALLRKAARAPLADRQIQAATIVPYRNDVNRLLLPLHSELNRGCRVGSSGIAFDSTAMLNYVFLKKV
jgi:hypothetical protein